MMSTLRTALLLLTVFLSSVHIRASVREFVDHDGHLVYLHPIDMSKHGAGTEIVMSGVYARYIHTGTSDVNFSSKVDIYAFDALTAASQLVASTARFTVGQLNAETPIRDALLPITQWAKNMSAAQTCQTMPRDGEYTAVHYTNIPALSPAAVTVVVELVAHKSSALQACSVSETHMAESKLPTESAHPFISYYAQHDVRCTSRPTVAVAASKCNTVTPHVADIIPGQVTVIDRRIHLTLIQDLLSAEECDYLIALARKNLERSTVTDSLGKEFVFSDRTSRTHIVQASADKMIAALNDRFARLTNQSTLMTVEQLQVVRYDRSQLYGPHFDWFHLPHRHAVGAQRRYTLFVYLNDVDEGGETYFSEVDHTFKPQKGAAIFWENCSDYETCHLLSYHQAKSVMTTKYGLNVWIDFET